MEEQQEGTGTNIPAGYSIAQTLQFAQQKSLPVIVNLGGGLKFSGRVKDISAHAVVMWRVSGKVNIANYITLSHGVSIEIVVRVGK